MIEKAFGGREGGNGNEVGRSSFASDDNYHDGRRSTIKKKSRRAPAQIYLRHTDSHRRATSVLNHPLPHGKMSQDVG